jgi:RimJ/RimL family protein N-acetyltransferase
MEMKIRSITLDDAEKYLVLLKRLDEETSFMLFEPGERKTTIDTQRQQIQKLLEDSRSIILVCEEHERLVGFIAGLGGNVARNRHSMYIVIGILQEYAGNGIGTMLFERLEHWARERGFHRLELTVMTHNERAIRLYKKMGFEVEGVKKHSLFVNGEYVDEYYMAKLI